ncbi:hypothetical protein QE152_g25873 [Popillia japonica]|uniref:Uncharacterized protein n=1 Tax=Popillia japonica TaxID=7064 RepID=A0AAW1K0J5_POPJA
MREIRYTLTLLEVYARNPLHADSPWIPGSIVNKTGNVSYDVKNLDTQSESKEQETENANQAATETIIINDDDNSNYDTPEPSISRRYNLRSRNN